MVYFLLFFLLYMLVKKLLRVVHKFKKDVWNLSLVTKCWRLRYLSDFTKASKLGYFYCMNIDMSVRYKYFFLYFYYKYKKNKKAFRKKIKPFIYRIDTVEKRIFKKKWKRKFLTLRLVKFFYAFLSYKQFRRMARLAKRKSGLFETNYILALEGRIVNFIYRTGIVDTIFHAYYFVKGGFITKNWKIITFPNETVNLFDIVSFLPFIFCDRWADYYFRLFHFNLVHPPMRCMFVSIIFLFFYFFIPPNRKDIPNRKIIDIYRLIGYPILF